MNFDLLCFVWLNEMYSLRQFVSFLCVGTIFSLPRHDEGRMRAFVETDSRVFLAHVLAKYILTTAKYEIINTIPKQNLMKEGKYAAKHVVQIKTIVC